VLFSTALLAMQGSAGFKQRSEVLGCLAGLESLQVREGWLACWFKVMYTAGNAAFTATVLPAQK
jgi:hypothetical protein